MIVDTIIKGVSELSKSAFGIVDELHTSDEEKAEAKLKLKKLVYEHEEELEKTVRQELESRERIVVSEMQQGDNFTKRARPTIVYVFLFVIVLNYCIFPIVGHFTGMPMPVLELPEKAWDAFTVVLSLYAVGRTWEKTKKGSLLDSAKNLYNGGKK